MVTPCRIEPVELVLKLGTWRPPLTPHAADQIEPAVQVDHAGAACHLMKPVNVLGQQQFAPVHFFQAGERAMGVVRPGAAEAPPPDHAARPITSARRLIAHEGLIGHRLHALPIAVGIAIVGYARVRAAAGAGQDDETSMAIDKVMESDEWYHEGSLASFLAVPLAPIHSLKPVVPVSYQRS
jgi:hypothetical protein